MNTDSKISEEEYKKALETIRQYNDQKSDGLLMNNLNYAGQQILYDGLDVGNMYPTDIDAALEFDNKHLILLEVKYENKKIPIGQKLILERIVDNWVNSGGYDGATRDAIVLKVSHTIPPDEPMVLAEGMVTEIYYNGKWQEKDKPAKVKPVLKSLARKWKINKLKSWYLL